MTGGIPDYNPALAQLAHYNSPEYALAQRQEANRKKVEAETQAKQNQLTRDEYTRNDLTAQRYALDQSVNLQGNPNTPRQITGTSMTIGGTPGDTGGSSSTSNRSSASGGSAGSRQLPPEIQGRFMPLIELGQIDQTPPNLPSQVQRSGGSFTPEDATGYQDAAYARLKARAGQEGRSAVDSLAAELGGRGIGGSGTFARGVGDRIASAVQPLADLNVAHLGDEYNAAGRSRQLAEQAASESYQGGINQRSTDIGASQALQQLRAQLAMQKYQGEIAQRGQDLDRMYRGF